MVWTEDLDFIYLFKRFYLFIFRERGRGGERERNINVWLPLVRPLLGTWPATQACALTGKESATLWFASWHSIHRVTPARDADLDFKVIPT